MSLLDKIKKAGKEVADALNGTPSLLREIKEKAAERKKTIVLCEGGLRFRITVGFFGCAC